MKKLFVLGTRGLIEDLQLAGFEVVEDDPQAVVVGFDRTLVYSRLCQASYWISQGLPYLATHPDRICPTNEATLLPDCGAICALIESATGRCPDAVTGKPNPTLLRLVMQQHNLGPPEVALVGDRVYTDIRMGRSAGVQTILTLTGESTRSQAQLLPQDQQPTLIVNNLAELSCLILESRSSSIA